MNIRPFRPADEAAVIALWQACGLTRPWNDPARDIQRKLQVAPELFLVGETVGKEIAGNEAIGRETVERETAREESGDGKMTGGEIVGGKMTCDGIPGGKIVGSVMAGYEGHRGWINYLAVAPRFRQQGYGRQLMEAAETLLRARGCPKINLQVRASNAEVVRFYEAIGFAVDDVVSFGKRLEHDLPPSG